MEAPDAVPAHLDPSELGTREYWEGYYQRDLDHDEADDDEDDKGPQPWKQLDQWFDDVGAPSKVNAFLISDTFPLSPRYIAPGDSYVTRERVSVLDLGCGNGSTLFDLRMSDGYQGQMVGVDYSSHCIELAIHLRDEFASKMESDHGRARLTSIDFEVFDVLNDDPKQQGWWPTSGSGRAFDLVLDKGTFDAVSLSSTTITNVATGKEQRISELYPSKVLPMVKIDGFFMITSCNWTEAEVISWFTATPDDERKGDWKFVVFDTIKYPVFQFGGQKGQGVASVCFRKVPANTQT